MSADSTGEFQITSWNESPVDEVEGQPKLTRATVTQTFSGVVDGKADVEYLMAYPSESSASAVGLARVTGTVAGRSGTFVLSASGSWSGGTVTLDVAVVPDSPTGELAGMSGEGRMVAREGAAGELTFTPRFG